MATDIKQQSRSAVQNMSKGEVVAGLGLATVLSGSRIGFSLAVMRAAFHTVRRSSFRPSFLHTTGLAAFTITASQAALAIDHRVTGLPGVFEQIQSQRVDDGKTRSERLTPQQARVLNGFRIDVSVHAIFFLFGAGLVSLGSGIHRGNIFRVVGGGCVGLQLWAFPRLLLVLNHRIANPDLHRG
ncbi:unnamed protein product [Cercospora beticola]|nr:unnamed protein product [Cercospora beticola]